MGDDRDVSSSAFVVQAHLDLPNLVCVSIMNSRSIQIDMNSTVGVTVGSISLQ